MRQRVPNKAVLVRKTQHAAPSDSCGPFALIAGQSLSSSRKRTAATHAAHWTQVGRNSWTV